MNEARFIQLISGERCGWIATVGRGLLSVFSWFYWAAVWLRNAAFHRGLKKIHSVDVPVVSVGNMTTGGTGKTPLVAYLANWFVERDWNVVLLSRGYRMLREQHSNGENPGNDEKRVLDRLCPGVPHLQQPDRVSAAQQAIEQQAAQLLILDDGFQHRRLHRDCDIVLIDALNPFGYGRLLPRGLLREPLTNLQRADFIIITRVDQCGFDELQAIRETISRYHPQCPIAEVAFRPICLLNNIGETVPLESLQGQRIVSFCGIGNPNAFQKTVADALPKSELCESLIFPDHHHYSKADREQIANIAEQQQATAIVTTLKDSVKFQQATFQNIPVWAVQISAVFVSNANGFEQFLQQIAQKFAQKK